jgi:DNA-binding NtrC family response regulator
MAATLKIDAKDRPFFENVAKIAFCNPFTEERSHLDATLVGREVDVFSDEHAGEISEALAAPIARLERNGKASLRKYIHQDRELMQTVFLFECFHRFCPQLDQLIEHQLKLGDQSAPVPFAVDLLSWLHRRGIGAAEAVRFFCIFYQLRRAFHFIVRGLIGQSPCMKEFRRHLWQNVFTREVRWYDRYLWNRMEDFSTLLLGETGTGKGAAAAAIGRSGYIPFDEKHSRFVESFARGFIALNLSQFPETLIESELFGHRKGAFTGAMEAHEGVLARCSPYGAIFLDEVGDVSVPVQIKLLQVLQDRSFCPVGSHEAIRFRGRVIAATNHPLENLQGKKLFREDFFYRLSSDLIEIPPLRQRLQQSPSELSQLIEHILRHIIGEKNGELQRKVEAVIVNAVGKDYSWPGNVRELAQAVRRTLITGNYSGASMPKRVTRKEALIEGIENETLNADQLLAGYCSLLFDKTRNYEEVARRTNLDRRTVKKYLLSQTNLTE